MLGEDVKICPRYTCPLKLLQGRKGRILLYLGPYSWSMLQNKCCLANFDNYSSYWCCRVGEIINLLFDKSQVRQATSKGTNVPSPFF